MVERLGAGGRQSEHLVQIRVENLSGIGVQDQAVSYGHILIVSAESVRCCDAFQDPSVIGVYLQQDIVVFGEDIVSDDRGGVGHALEHHPADVAVPFPADP